MIKLVARGHQRIQELRVSHLNTVTGLKGTVQTLPCRHFTRQVTCCHLSFKISSSKLSTYYIIRIFANAGMLPFFLFFCLGWLFVSHIAWSFFMWYTTYISWFYCCRMSTDVRSSNPLHSQCLSFNFHTARQRLHHPVQYR